jgi:hypothetical protein
MNSTYPYLSVFSSEVASVIQSTSVSIGDTSLCERCNLLSFDDLAIGGQEVEDEEGFARLSFEDTRIEFRENDETNRDYSLVRLGWCLKDTLPDMPHLLDSSQLGCAFCNALRLQIKESLARSYYSIQNGPLILIVYLSLFEEGIEGLLIEGTFNETESEFKTIRIMFPIEAAPSKSDHLSFLLLAKANVILTIARSG